MKYRYLVLVALAMLLSGCSLFGGDDTSTDVATAENFEAEPTANVVQAVPADDTAAEPAVAAEAPLPTAVTIPATAVPPEPTPDRSQPTSYVVQSGDVLGLIAERFDVDIAELRRVNDLSGNLIRVGQTLTIPALSGSTVLEGAEPADETASAPVGSTTAPTPAPVPTPVSCGANAVGHCVQSGDSLLGIASEYGVSVDQLRASNPGISGDTIRIGDLLTIPGQTTTTTTTDTTTDSSTGTVSTPAATVTVAPLSDADCAARNPEFPYFHASDGLCYANPIGGPTAIPTAQGADASTDAECPEGTFLWDDGLCYPIPGTTPTAGATPTPGTITVDYGTTPCADGFEVLDTGRCWPGDGVTDAQKEAACKANCEYI